MSKSKLKKGNIYFLLSLYMILYDFFVLNNAFFYTDALCGMKKNLKLMKKPRSKLNKGYIYFLLSPNMIFI